MNHPGTHLVGLRPTSHSKWTRGATIPYLRCLLALVLALDAGCTFVVDRPRTITGQERVSGIQYADAVDYLNETHDKFQASLENLDKFDNFTKGAVGLGVGGAGIAAVFRGSLNTILGFLSFGAANYTVNQLSDPKTVGDVFSAGLSNLDCIDAAGAVAYQSTEAARMTLPATRAALVSAVNSLRRDERYAASAADPKKYATDVERADAAIGPANAAITKIDQYLNGTSVGEAMVAAVNTTITAVNEQIRAKAPSIDAIAQSGSISSNFINANGNLRANTQAAIRQGQGVGLAQGEKVGQNRAAAPTPDELELQFAADMAALNSAVQDIPPLDASSIANVASCKAQFAAEAPVTVQPPGPVSLTPGGQTKTLNVTTKGFVRVQWDGVNPPAGDVVVSTNFNQVTLSATSSATAAGYTMEIVDAVSGKSSGAIEVDVSSSKGTNKPTGPAAAKQQKQQKQQKQEQKQVANGGGKPGGQQVANPGAKPGTTPGPNVGNRPAPQGPPPPPPQH